MEPKQFENDDVTALCIEPSSGAAVLTHLDLENNFNPPPFEITFKALGGPSSAQ